jgi:TRAP-type C4-dicarboxylate transport system permease small subunit
VDSLKPFIRSLNSRTINTTFGITYGAALVMALFPPLYLASSGIRTPLLGIPFSLMYWLINALIVGLALWALYVVEDIRGELDEYHTPAAEAEVTA